MSWISWVSVCPGYPCYEYNTYPLTSWISWVSVCPGYPWYVYYIHSPLGYHEHPSVLDIPPAARLPPVLQIATEGEDMMKPKAKLSEHKMFILFWFIYIMFEEKNFLRTVWFYNYMYLKAGWSFSILKCSFKVVSPTICHKLIYDWIKI